MRLFVFAILAWLLLIAAGALPPNTLHLTKPPKLIPATAVDADNITFIDSNGGLAKLAGWRIKFWEERVKTILPKFTSASIFGLFSYGGWSNQGQFFLVVPDKGASEFWYTKPNEIEWQHSSLKAADLPSILNTFTMQDLDRKAFDSLEYQFIAAKWERPKLTIQRLTHFLAVLESNPQDRVYIELINAFEHLRRASSTGAKLQ